ncbi:MAG: hypothetical protein K6A92_07485 [Lachnospiraceae bacterium]|nr:hypothetical protein [Lachnospiraceae bacterium]
MSMQDTAQGVWEDYDNFIARFHRDSYADGFTEFYTRNAAFYQAVSEDKDVSSLADAVAQAFSSLLEEERSRSKRSNLQMNGNLFMVIYVLPGLYEKLPGEKAGEVVKVFTDAWEKAFPGNKLEGTSKDSIQEGFRKKLCYITTAVCENRNMGTSCEELQLIRSFRDEYMASFPEGRALIEEYYDIAPTIVKRIGKAPNPDSIYGMIWQEYIRPCVDKIKEGDLSGCMDLYCRMVENLRELFIYHYKRG